MPTDTPNPRPISRGDFMTLQDIEAALGLSPNGTRELVLRDGFPDPFGKVWRSELWRTADVEAWRLEQLRAGFIYGPRS